MKRFYFLTTVLALSLVLISSGWAQEKSESKTQTQVKAQEKVQKKNTVQTSQQAKIIHGPYFIDKNGDGYNDNAPDHDGDGIPNGLDPDYQGAGKGMRKQQFVDTDGDGIADNVGLGRGFGKRGNRRGGYGPANGTGNQGVRPQNGTGYGPGAGSGNCDGTGPKGRMNRGPRQ